MANGHRKREVELINELIANLPAVYDSKNLQLVYQYGYMIGLLRYIAKEDFYAHNIIANRIEYLKEQNKKK